MTLLCFSNLRAKHAKKLYCAKSSQKQNKNKRKKQTQTLTMYIETACNVNETVIATTPHMTTSLVLILSILPTTISDETSEFFTQPFTANCWLKPQKRSHART